MRYVTGFLIALLVITTTCFSQSVESADIRDVTTITILSPGLSYEKRIGRLQSLNVQAFMRLSAYWGYSDYFGSTGGVDLDPALELGYRYYYNVASRLHRNKRIEMNSANYFGATHQSVVEKRSMYDTATSKTKFRVINSIGLLWGMQRNYRNRLSVDVAGGIGYAYGKPYVADHGSTASRFFLITGLKIGFWLNTRG